MIVYGIIPARGGSVRIPHKNIVPLRGKPLIEYTIRAAQESKCLDRIIVSTDCVRTANIASDLGVQVVMRPDALSRGDGVHPGVVAAHCLESLPKPDAVMWLQPTSPLRKAEWIQDAVAMMREMNCDSVVSYVDAEPWHLRYMVHLLHESQTSRVIAMPRLKLGLRSGDIYLTKTDVLLSCDLYGKDSRALIIPRDRYCNINEPVDLKIAEALL